MTVPDLKRTLTQEQIDLPLHTQRALEVDMPGHWSDGQRRNYSCWHSTNEQAATRAQRDAVERAVGLRDEQMTRLTTTTEEAVTEAERIADAVEHGRMTHDDAYRALSAVARRWGEGTSLLESLQVNEQEIATFADADPADLEADRHKRFRTANRGNTLTASVLDGESG